MENGQDKQRYTLFFLGILILTLGVALTIKADIGVGAWDSVNVALNTIYGLSVGTFAVIISVIMIVISGLLRNGKFNFYTLVTAFLLGIFTDLWIKIVMPINIMDSLIIKLCCFTFGVVLLAFGIALYIQPKLAPNPIDDFMIALKNKLDIKIFVSKLLVDVLGLIIGLLLNGPIGLGTLIITVVLGPLVGLFNEVICKMFK